MRRLLILGALVFLAAPAVAKERRRRILLSNDDGITSPGLVAVYAELAKLREVTVEAIHAGFVAVTPHRIDLNDKEARQAIEAWGLR